MADKTTNEANYDKQKAMKLWRKGYTMAELAEHFGYTKDTIKKYLHLEGGMDYENCWNEHQQNYKERRRLKKHKNQTKLFGEQGRPEKPTPTLTGEQ